MEKETTERKTAGKEPENLLSGRRPLNELNLMDDFLMSQMIAHPVYGKPFSKKILEIILQRKIGKLSVVIQKTYPGEDTDKHGIRLDAYLDEEGGEIFDLEPDKNDRKEMINALPKRVRFYHAKIDAGSFASGMNYEALRDVIIIFITAYDPFGLDRMVYTISAKCEEVPEMCYDDGAKSIFLYTKGTKGEVPENLRKLLCYMEHSNRENAITEELKEIHKMILAVKRDKKVGLTYMKSYEIDRMLLEQGRVEGKKEGKQEGIKEGIKAFIRDNIEEGKTEKVIIEKLIRCFQLKEEAAKKYFEELKIL